MSKKFISEFKVNEQIDDCFVLRRKNLKLTKYDKPYLQITLSDKTGRIEGRIWDNAEKFNELAETGDIVRVKGSISKYKEEKQIKLDYMEKADDRSFLYKDMVRTVENIDEVFDKVCAHLDKIKNPWISKLAKSFIEDKKFIEALKEGIGGKSWHNAYIGGLLEHTLEVMYVADILCNLYSEADRDIVVFGAFIHDMGKTFELDPKNMEYTIAGGLVGHIAIGYRMLIDKISKIDGFPKDLSLRLEHVILSHHGEYEQQSPVLPKTLEATIVYHTDELVSQANAIKEIQVNQAEEGKVWSQFVSIKNRKYFIKDASEEDWKEKSKEENKSMEDNFFDEF